ncbi:Uma2 family endonuclease, partial [Microcoleus anatoxicus]
NPLIAIEFLSPSTEDEDLGLTESEPNKPPTKWQVYERILKIPYYFVFSKYNNQLRVFHLIGNRYREQVLTGSRFWIPEIQLSLGLWQGAFLQNERLWLRWYDFNGNLVPTPEEFAKKQAQLEAQRAEFERQQAELERQRAESEKERANRLADRLRAMGINPDEL